MATTASAAAIGGQAPDRRRYLILAICCMSLFIVGLDNTIVNIALPSIRRELHATVPQPLGATHGDRHSRSPA